MALIQPFDDVEATLPVSLLPGRWVLIIECGGSTVELQASARGADSFVTIPLPDDSTSTSTDQFVEVPGGLDYRLNCTAYVGAGSIQASRASN